MEPAAFFEIDTLLARSISEYAEFLEGARLAAGKVAQDRPRAVTRAYDLDAGAGTMTTLPGAVFRDAAELRP